MSTASPQVPITSTISSLTTTTKNVSSTTSPVGGPSILASINGTSKATNGTSAKVIDCAKDCPCGLPPIPTPDQWLEKPIFANFKVWHVIFIIIAILVTLIVVYCCFHRCRIPRTKQEIEADLMRTNMTTKFRDYIQDLPNESTTFIEVLKRVQELEEKLEKEEGGVQKDAGMRKRMGWLRLRGKDSAPQNQTDIEAGQAEQQTVDATTDIKEPEVTKANGVAAPSKEVKGKLAPLDDPQHLGELNKMIDKELKPSIERMLSESKSKIDATPIITPKPTTNEIDEKGDVTKAPSKSRHKRVSRSKNISPSPEMNSIPVEDGHLSPNDEHRVTPTGTGRRRKPSTKPNLSRTKPIRDKSNPSREGSPKPDQKSTKDSNEPTKSTSALRGVLIKKQKKTEEISSQPEVQNKPGKRKSLKEKHVQLDDKKDREPSKVRTPSRKGQIKPK